MRPSEWPFWLRVLAIVLYAAIMIGVMWPISIFVRALPDLALGALVGALSGFALGLWLAGPLTRLEARARREAGDDLRIYPGADKGPGREVGPPR